MCYGDEDIQTRIRNLKQWTCWSQLRKQSFLSVEGCAMMCGWARLDGIWWLWWNLNTFMEYDGVWWNMMALCTCTCLELQLMLEGSAKSRHAASLWPEFSANSARFTNLANWDEKQRKTKGKPRVPTFGPFPKLFPFRHLSFDLLETFWICHHCQVLCAGINLSHDCPRVAPQLKSGRIENNRAKQAAMRSEAQRKDIGKPFGKLRKTASKKSEAYVHSIHCGKIGQTCTSKGKPWQWNKISKITWVSLKQFPNCKVSRV